MVERCQDFTIYVRSLRSGKEWGERYQKETDNPEQWGRDLIAWFNSTTRTSESKRKFIRVEIHGEVPPPEHAWSKTSLVTQQHAGRMFDKMKCERCGITGKRFRLNQNIKRDSEFRAKLYARCDLTIKHREALSPGASHG